MVKTKGPIWQHFLEKICNENKTKLYCNYCDKEVTKNATRMVKHLNKCILCPENVKTMFANVSITKIKGQNLSAEDDGYEEPFEVSFSSAGQESTNQSMTDPRITTILLHSEEQVGLY